MIRNLVLKLPGIKCSSDYALSTSFRQRNFRSLSPFSRVRTSVRAERSVSCSRVESGHIVDVSRTPRARTLCFSKECYAQKHDDNIKEIQWRDEIKPKKKEEPVEREQFDSLEQYELEAAKPRPVKSRDVIEALKTKQVDGFLHLQPSQIKPYGSQNNMYASSLIKPASLLKYPRKFKKIGKKDSSESDRQNNTDVENSGHRNFSTSADIRKLSTSKSYVAREGSSTKDQISSKDNTNTIQKSIDNIRRLVNPKSAGEIKFEAFKRASHNFKEPWAEPKYSLEFKPPVFLPGCDTEATTLPFRFSTEKERRLRRQKENQNRGPHYRCSYSDLLKLKLKEVKEEKVNLLTQDPPGSSISTKKPCLGCLLNSPTNSKQMLQVTKSLPEKRSLTTRSKSNLLTKELVTPTSDSTIESTLLTKKAMKDSPEQRNYSKSRSKSGKGAKSKKSSNTEREYNPECENICSPILKALNKSVKKTIPFEPRSCEQHKIKKIYLPSHVKLPVPPCTPRPEHLDCKKVDPCPPRADECLVHTSKKLPRLPPGNCPCIEPPVPTRAPKLEKLNLKFEDPPKVVCVVPPCQTPRADDSNPYKYKPLKPYVPGECECIQPPPMKDVKLKRLPRCAPEEICRPVRVCPVIEKCPMRADACLTIEPKPLPPINPSPCPCIDPHVPNVAPPMKRLDLKVPEPPRACPKPPPCPEKERADDHLKLKRKKLPKFVPGDCPCEDKPMVDWNLKRLVCEDEPPECIVPDPCKAFPRADWGCWEYQDEVCEEVDEKCIDKSVKCPPPKPPKGHPCDRYNPCETSRSSREVRHMPKRKFSHSSASLKLYQKVKGQNGSEDDNYRKSSVNTYKPPEIKRSKTKMRKNAENKIVKVENKKLKSKSTLNLIKILNDLESKKGSEDPLLFKPVHNDKLNYEKILQTIASSTIPVPKKEPKAGVLFPNLKRPKTSTIKVTSRAISTTKTISKDEKEIKDEKQCEGKKKCKEIRPSMKALMCRKKCPTIRICDKGGESRAGCKVERVPVCCEKEESPYPAFSENLQESIKPYTKTPQFTCNRVQYGFHPSYKKEYDPLDDSKKKNSTADEPNKQDKKKFSTCTLIDDMSANISPITERSRSNRIISSAGARLFGTKTSTYVSKMPSKAFLKKSPAQNVAITQNRTLSSKIFQIQPPAIAKPDPNKKCEVEPKTKPKPPKTICHPIPPEYSPRLYCKRDSIDLNCKRKPPPFPAFSDCLDEEMESILTECPLDREKYLRMQPRFMNPPKKPFTLKPPPPIQGKIDLLKEQQCIREKLCIGNEGITQSCRDFGKPIPLMKTKKLFKDKKHDCDRMEELKRMGRWPPFTLKQNRRLCTFTSIARVESKNLSTLGFNSVPEISKESQNTNKTKRVYIRDYHALVKGTDKSILNDNELKLKELTQKMFPDMDESTKLLKLRNNQWRITNLKNYELLNRHSNVAKRVKRFYSTYKTKHKNFLRRQTKGLTIKSHITRRKIANNAKLLDGKNNSFRGNRTLKIGKPSNSARRERIQYHSNKKGHPKFTLNYNPVKGYKKSGFRRQRSKPFTPCPSFSEYKDDLASRRPEVEECIRKLQPGYNILSNSQFGPYPEQERVDRTLCYEYYKCKKGLKNEGITMDCDSFNLCPRKQDSCDQETSDKNSGNSKCDSNSNVVEFLVQEHEKHSPITYEETTTCCSQSNTKIPKKKNDDCEDDRKKLENICMQHCIKCIPCHLPEEEKYCACREECKKIYQCDPKPECVRCEEREEEKICKPKILKSKKYKCGLAKEDCCAPRAECTIKKIKKCTTTIADCCVTKADCCTSRADCCTTETDCCTSKAVICPPEPCPPKKSRSITQLENFWQRIVNYFKARPNCPEPGEWKKKALKQKAEKAAKAAGLITVDPKCLPPSILRTAQVPKKDCKICPKKDACEKRESECDIGGRRNFCTSAQPSTHYSASINHENIEEINKLLDEAKLKEQLVYKGGRTNNRKGFAIFSERKDTDAVEALKISLDSELYRPVDFSKLFFKNGRPSRTYFGYSDIIPSRENILERAWRISIESYNKYNYPKTYNFFNEFFNKMEKSIQSVEDLEKLKTENVLRELDEFLKNQDSDKDKS